MVRPIVVSSAATAMIRWNDVMGRPSQAPNRVRGPRTAESTDAGRLAGSSASGSALDGCVTGSVCCSRGLSGRGAHGRGERVSAVCVAAELIERGARRGQEHGVPRPARPRAASTTSVIAPATGRCPRRIDDSSHRAIPDPLVSISRHLSILPRHNLDDGDIGCVS